MNATRLLVFLVVPVLLTSALWLLLKPAAADPQNSQYLVYVGTYTAPGSKGIYAWRFDAHAGTFSDLGLAATVDNPSFLEPHPNGRFLYSVSETDNFQGQKSGSVNAFTIDQSTGKLTLLNQVSSGGAWPCHLALDRTGTRVLVANYGAGSVTVLPVRQDGSLEEASSFVQHAGSSVNPRRQEAPHAHSVNPSPDNRFILAADLGLDKVLVYRFDTVKASLVPNKPAFAALAPGAGPRHLAFSPSGSFVYVINELNSSVTVFAYEKESGALTELQTVSTLPDEFEGENSTAEVRVHPSGKFLYGSNRGHNSIAVFTVDPASGKISSRGHVATGGSTPRNFNIDPTGKYLLAANQKSNDVVVFTIDPGTGQLHPTGQQLSVSSPVCVRFLALESPGQ
jgi:6-phosphogluconolactonase